MVDPEVRRNIARESYNRRKQDIRPTIQAVAAALAITGGLFAWYQQTVIADTAEDAAVVTIEKHDAKQSAHFETNESIKERIDKHDLELVQMGARIETTAEAVTRIDKRTEQILTAIQRGPLGD